jgi:translation elongation factor EF-G
MTARIKFYQVASTTPLIEIEIEPKSKADQEKLGVALG